MKKILFVVIGLILLSGCSKSDNNLEATKEEVLRKNAAIDSLRKVAVQLDSLYNAGKVKYNKVEKLSNADVSVYAVNGDTTYFEGKARLMNYGVEFSDEVAKLIGRKAFVSVDGITNEQLKTTLTTIDSLRKLNKP